LTTQVHDKIGELQAEVDRARAAHIQAQEELVQVRRDYRSAAQRGDGEAMAGAWRQGQELPHVIMGCRLRALQAEIALLEPQVEAAYQAEQKAAQAVDDAVRQLPHGRRLYADSPPAHVQLMASVHETHQRARQANATLQGRLKEVRGEHARLLGHANIDY
jgi:hypothetical protein